MRNSKEKEIQASILQYLSLRKLFHWRQNSGMFQTKGGGFYSMGKVGAPDIFVIKDGKCYGLEVKTEKGKLQETQKIFGQDFAQAGGFYHVVRSIEDVRLLGL